MSSNKVFLRPASSPINRRQPLLRQSKSTGQAGTHLGEAVGGTAAVCCCCPCAVANIVYLAVYKVPATLCIRAVKKRMQRRRRRVQSSVEEMFQARRRCTCGCCDDISVGVFPTCGVDDLVVGGVNSKSEEEDKDIKELEKEMWDRFYSTGFWRSSSRREGHSSSSSFSSQRVVIATSAPSLQVLAV